MGKQREYSFQGEGSLAAQGLLNHAVGGCLGGGFQWKIMVSVVQGTKPMSIHTSRDMVTSALFFKNKFL